MSEERNDQLNQKASSQVDPKDVDAAVKKLGDDSPRRVNMACRRGDHVDGRPGASSGDGDLKRRCASTQVFVMNDVMEGVQRGQTIYRCCDCGYSWTVATGSTFSF